MFECVGELTGYSERGVQPHRHGPPGIRSAAGKARNWSAASHKRFSSEVEAAAFSVGAIQRIKGILPVL